MKKKLTVLLSLLFVLLVVMGCTSTPPGTTKVPVPEASFESDSNGKLRITNMTSSELLIFVGQVERGNLLGAIGTGANGHARSRLFDLKKIAGLPPTGSFLFRATTFEKLNKTLAGITEEDVIYTGLISYDLNDPQSIERDIFAGIDPTQSTFIHVTNRSPYVLQLRLDSSDGETVATLAPGQRLKKIWIKPKDTGLPYEFFPTYVYADPKTGEINAFSDVENVNGKRFEPEPNGPDIREITFTGPGSGGPQYNVAFIRFQNDTNSLLNFMTASGNYKKNDRGTTNTSPGRTDSYQIDSGSSTMGKTYSNLIVRSDEGEISIGSLEVFPGHIYDVVVTTMNGTYQAAIRDAGVKSLDDNIRISLWGDGAN
jgi:hypothetical protein